MGNKSTSCPRVFYLYKSNIWSNTRELIEIDGIRKMKSFEINHNWFLDEVKETIYSFYDMQP